MGRSPLWRAPLQLQIHGAVESELAERAGSALTRSRTARIMRGKFSLELRLEEVSQGRCDHA